MQSINREFLQRIAEIHVGRPVFVGMAPRDANYWGNADYEGCYCIRLQPVLLAQRIDELAFTFFHEVGHLALGHVPDHVYTGQRYDRNEASQMLADTGNERWRGLIEIIDQREREADDWATKEVVRMRERCAPYALEDLMTENRS